MAAKSKLYMLDDYIVLDLETTGHYPGIDEIIEIGAIRVIENEMIESFQTFVKCEFIPPDIMELTGITPENLENAASPDIAISALEDFIGNSTIIGHNLSFDLTFLKYYGSKYTSDSIEWIDTLRLSRKMISSDHGHGLTTLCALAGINRDIKHRSIADCKSTHELYQYLKKTAIESGKTFEDYFKKKYRYRFQQKIDLRSFTPETEEFDETHPFYGKIIVFTGNIDGLSRAEAAQCVVNLGGSCGNNVTRKTNYVVIGSYDPHQGVKGKSGKTKKAEELIAKDFPIEIITQHEFLDLIGI
ncbi:MAG: exonuclease [Tissierellia bacterium]|nr:exonuclease [Tissierellia bacterium]